MTGSEFVQYVKAKLSRLDTAFHEDVRTEEVLMYAHDALKSLTIEYDSGKIPSVLDSKVIAIYLSSVTEDILGDLSLIEEGKFARITISNYLKLKNLTVEVTAGTATSWQPTREIAVDDFTGTQYNPFTKGFPDRPSYFFSSGFLVFPLSGYVCNKIKAVALKNPAAIEENSNLSSIPFVKELQDKTVTLILENLESRRIQTQPVISRV